MTEQSINTRKAHLDEPVSFMRVTHRNVGGGNLQDVGKGLLTGTWVRDYLEKHK